MMILLSLHLLNYQKKWKKFDGFVHSIGFAPADQLEGDFLEVTNREGFNIAHDISSYSFTAMAKESKSMQSSRLEVLSSMALTLSKARISLTEKE